MNKQKVFNDANRLFNSVLANFDNASSDVQNNIEDPLWKRRKRSKAEIAYEKFTESTLNEISFVEPFNVELKRSERDTKVSVSTDILSKIQNLEHKLATTETIWANALTQLTALHELAGTIKNSNDTKLNKTLQGDHKILIILPTLPVKSIDELMEFEKAVSNSSAVAECVKSILEEGDDMKYHHSHTKFIKWNIAKLIKPEVATDVSWSNPNGFQLKNSAFIKILIKRINIKFPMISYIYIVEQILAILAEFRSTSKKIETPLTNVCTE